MVVLAKSAMGRARVIAGESRGFKLLCAVEDCEAMGRRLLPLSVQYETLLHGRRGRYPDAFNNEGAAGRDCDKATLSGRAAVVLTNQCNGAKDL